ncbi:MAG: MTH865 family protein [Haloarculaceae archaeon]|jgi:hypothetical protein
MVDRDDLREQFTEAFEGADYPVDSPMDLVPALPDGPSTSFESGEFSMSAIELNTELEPEFPYEDVEPFVDDLMNQLEEEGFIGE